MKKAWLLPQSRKPKLIRSTEDTVNRIIWKLKAILKEMALVVREGVMSKYDGKKAQAGAGYG